MSRTFGQVLRHEKRHKYGRYPYCYYHGYTIFRFRLPRNSGFGGDFKVVRGKYKVWGGLVMWARACMECNSLESAKQFIKRKGQI